jgi:4-amino-4-deoxy-L-arabinose transferase-like glycosyltransferase
MIKIRDSFLEKEIVFLFFIFILTRIFFLVALPDVLISSDSLEYIELSHNLKNNFAFERNGYPETYRTPIYPLYLASFLFVGISNTKIIVCSQIVLLAFTSIIFFKLSKTYFNRSAAYITWILILLDPGNHLIGFSLLTEAIFVFFIAVLIYVWHRLINRQSIYDAILFGFICGLLCLIRPIAAYMFVVCIFGILLSPSIFNNRIQVIIFFLIGVLLTQGAWMLRNYVHYDELYLTEISSASLYVYWAQAVSAESDAKDPDALYENAWQEWDREKQRLTPPEMKNHFYRHAMRILKSSPEKIPIVFMNGIVRLIVDSGFSKYVIVSGVDLPVSFSELKKGLFFENGLLVFLLSLLSLLIRLVECLISIVMHSLLIFVPFQSMKTARCSKNRAVIIMVFMIALYLILFSCAPSANVRFREQYFCLGVFLTAPIILQFAELFGINQLLERFELL